MPQTGHCKEPTYPFPNVLVCGRVWLLLCALLVYPFVRSLATCMLVAPLAKEWVAIVLTLPTRISQYICLMNTANMNSYGFRDPPYRIQRINTQGTRSECVYVFPLFG